MPSRHPLSLRAPVTDETFYFVMADRFENGDMANDTGRSTPGPAGDRFDPTTEVLQRRRSRWAAQSARLHRGPRDDVDLAHPELQEQACPTRRRTNRRLPRLLDHRLHSNRPAPGYQHGAARARRCRSRPRHEGLLRHHHQPHGGRDRLRDGRALALRVEGRRSLSDMPPASRSTTATTPAPARSRRWTRKSPFLTGTPRCSRPARRTSRSRTG